MVSSPALKSIYALTYLLCLLVDSENRPIISSACCFFMLGDKYLHYNFGYVNDLYNYPMLLRCQTGIFHMLDRFSFESATFTLKVDWNNHVTTVASFLFDMLCFTTPDQYFCLIKIYEILMAVMGWFMIPFLLFLGIPGNVLSAIVFYRQGIRERINVCLFILALADLVNIIFLLFMYVEDRVRKHLNPDSWFIVYIHGVSSVEWASQFLSAVISCERCFCVVSPLHAKRLLKTSTMTAIVVVCCVVLMAGMCVIVIPKHTLGSMYDPSANTTKFFVTVTKYYIDNKKIIDIFDIIIYSTILPITFFIAIAICTTITTMKLHAAVKQRTSMTNSMTGAERSLPLRTNMSSKEVAVTRMLIGTSVMFLVCMIPTVGVQIFSILPEELTSTSVYFTLNAVLWSFVLICRGVRSSTHFCVYYIMGSRFRESVHSFCLCIGRTSNDKSLMNEVTRIKSGVDTHADFQ